MKFTNKLPSTDKDLSERLIKDGWTKLKEPSNLIMATILSLPFMLINLFVYLALMFIIYPPFKEFLLNQNASFSFTIKLLPIIILIVGCFIIMTVHELIHAIFIPGVLNSNKTFWGITGLYGFVFTTEKLKKGRFILISIMPFILLSIVLPIILSLFGWLNNYIVILCLLNAGGASVDFLNVFIVLTQVSNHSFIINNGFETYHKKISYD